MATVSNTPDWANCFVKTSSGNKAVEKVWIKQNGQLVTVYDGGGSAAVNFATDSWETISAACKDGSYKTVYQVGDTKDIELSTGETITVAIMGFDHDDLSDGSGKAPITLGMENALAKTYPMNSSDTNAGGWTNCLMRTSTMAMLFTQLPSDLQAIIKEVNKLTSAGSKSSTINTTVDKLFLFSLEEVMGTNNRTTTHQYTFAGEGEQYEYFKNAPIPTPTTGTGSFSVLKDNSGTFYTTDTSVATGYTNKLGQAKTTTANIYYNYNNAKAQGDDGTSAITWWIRSPYYNYRDNFCCISSTGATNSDIYSIADSSFGVSFGFCIG